VAFRYNIPMRQRKSARWDKVEIYLHLIWTTWDREPWISSSWEEEMFAIIHGALDTQRSFLLAAGCVEDHVHLLVSLHATTCVGDLMKAVKGTSAHYGARHVPLFKWRPTYAAFSVSRWNVPSLKKYIRNQKGHHSVGTTKEALETSDEEYEYCIDDAP